MWYTSKVLEELLRCRLPTFWQWVGRTIDWCKYPKQISRSKVIAWLIKKLPLFYGRERRFSPFPHQMVYGHLYSWTIGLVLRHHGRDNKCYAKEELLVKPWINKPWTNEASDHYVTPPRRKTIFFVPVITHIIISQLELVNHRLPEGQPAKGKVKTAMINATPGINCFRK